MIESFVLAVFDGPVGIKGCETTANSINQCNMPFNVQKAFMLTGKAGIRKVFCGRAASYCYGLIAVVKQVIIGISNGHLEIQREHSIHKKFTGGRADGGKI